MNGGKLTDEMIAGAVIPAGQTTRKLFDGHGLYLFMSAKGARQWRLKYGPNGGDRTKTFGEYPAVSIDAARQAVAAFRATLAAPKLVLAPMPAPEPLPAVLAAPAQVPTFGQVAAHWVEFDKEITPAALYRKRLHVQKFAPLHDVPIDRVQPEQCIALFEQIRAESGLHTAMRAGLYMSCIFKHAVRWRVIHNPAEDRRAWVGRSDRKALAERRQDHITDPNAFGLLMERVDLWQSPQGPTSAAFIRFIARVPVRASELAGGRFSEFRDLDKPDSAVWNIPAERMKQRQAHDVPLPRQAVAILLEQRNYVAKHYPIGSEYVFPHRDTGAKHIDGDNQRRTLTFLGYGPESPAPQSVHGFRHSFLTMAAEAGQSLEIADRCLAHSDGNKVRARYNMSVQMSQRRAVLQWWADEIERMKNGYTVAAA